MKTRVISIVSSAISISAAFTDAKLLTDGEEVKSQSLFSRLNSKETITGENDAQESELKYLAEIRYLRDKNSELFDRIKRLQSLLQNTAQIMNQQHARDLVCRIFLQAYDKANFREFTINLLNQIEETQLVKGAAK